MLNRLRENFSFAKIYAKEIILSNTIFFLIFSIALQLSLVQIFITLGLLFVVNLYFIDVVGKKQKEQFDTIRNIIHKIRNNEFLSPDEIKLEKHLVELEGDIKGMFLRTQNDISNLKKLEQSRKEFLGNVSHELRTPIFAIQGFIETLLDGAIDDEKVNRNFLRKAFQHTDNLNNLLNDLIDISMIETGQMRMSFRYFNIKDYLETIVNELAPHAEAKNLQLVLRPIKSKLQLFGDKDRLKQVMVNLISNAIKYSEEGQVEIIVEEQERTGRIIVKDSGIGITEEDKERIFERFYRVDKQRSRAVGGTGLGLAIVKHIIDAHGSKIEVKSEYGKGSEFSFALKK
ncbi:MAG: ATP-binding protein [Melioribacteraceae bacterium]|nr:ATP-binding protein [Melioribacteraceae bacterium]MCF8265641.1 ATP-binding protein [Melioribacteraceae bacterium]MCF8414276.1 ATP-binding protein [Melioribacteraceae bacterium]